MLPSKDWWAARRLRYNIGLIIAGVTAFVCYVVLGEFLIMPYDKEYETTLFTIFFQGIGYLFMIGIANIFYNLGRWTDRHFNTRDSQTFRQRLFNLGFWFSFGLPFLIPILIIVVYLVEYRK